MRQEEKVDVMLVTVLAAITMIWAIGAPLPNLWMPVGICTALFAVSFYWQPNLLRGLAALVAFSAAFTLLMEAVAASGRPLVDESLASIDATLGFSSVKLVAWVAQYPWLSLIMKCAYFSVIPQTCLVMLVNAEKPDLWVFLRRFFLAAQITVCFFFFFPAEGVATCITPQIAARFYALRAGAPLDWQQAQGIITFPSFHTAWAIILMATFWKSPLRWPAIALNALMIASTVTTGGHYFIDVPAGAIVGLLAILQPAVAVNRIGWPTKQWPHWMRLGGHRAKTAGDMSAH